MRIVGGELGGRVLKAPPGEGTRPTTDRVREALASALQARGAIEGASVLDLFAGSGALAFEALSRGASKALLVEADRRALRVIADNATALGVATRTRTLRIDLLADPARVVGKLDVEQGGPFDLVFADPPYADSASVAPLVAALADAGLLAADAFIVVEHAHGQALPVPACVAQLAAYRYGDTAVVLWQRVANSPAA